MVQAKERAHEPHVFICVLPEGKLYRQIDAMRRDTQSGPCRLSMKRGGKPRPAHTIPSTILPVTERNVKLNLYQNGNSRGRWPLTKWAFRPASIVTPLGVPGSLPCCKKGRCFRSGLWGFGEGGIRIPSSSAGPERSRTGRSGQP